MVVHPERSDRRSEWLGNPVLRHQDSSPDGTTSMNSKTEILTYAERTLASACRSIEVVFPDGNGDGFGIVEADDVYEANRPYKAGRKMHFIASVHAEVSRDTKSLGQPAGGKSVGWLRKSVDWRWRVLNRIP